MTLRFSALALALICSGAFAQSADTSSVDQLLNHPNMREISDGLYAKTSKNSIDYVAVSSAGRSALLQKLLEFRATRMPPADPSLDPAEQMIAQLSAPTAKMAGQESGDCSGPGGTGYPRISASTTVSYTSAMGSAEVTLDFSPVTPTTNRASGAIYDRTGALLAQQSSTGTGTSAAHVSISAAAGCQSLATASVTCPHYVNASVISFSQTSKPTCSN